MTTVSYDQLVPDQIAADVNQLTISGHVQREPELSEEHDGVSVCRFVLSHAVGDHESGHWELQLYHVNIYGPLGQSFASTHQPGQKVIITGCLTASFARRRPAYNRSSRSSPTASSPSKSRPWQPTATPPSSRPSYREHRERPAATIAGRLPT
jgi:single-stranded DNA-binding protein